MRSGSFVSQNVTVVSASERKKAETEEENVDEVLTSRKPLFNWREIATIFCVLAISALTHLPNLKNPPYNIFDETHFGGFVSDYVRGICFFDIHPPLAKLMLAGVAKATGYDGKFNFSNHGGKYTSDFYVPMRMLPAVCSTLIAPLMTATLILNHCGCMASFLVGLMMALEFTGIVQGRLILTDGILYFFVALTMFFTALMERVESYPVLVLQALAAGCALSVKFTGACVLTLVAISNMRMLYLSKRKTWFAELCLRGAIVAIVCIATLFLTIFIHLEMMPHRGFGDRYMPPDFRQRPMLVRIVDLIKAMFEYNKNLRFTHPYQSEWWEWPIWHAVPTLLYDRGPTKLLCIFNNPVCAVLSLVGFVIGCSSWDFKYSFAYMASYAPLILVKRCMWTYHYEISLMFGIMALCHTINRFPKVARNVLCVVIALATIAAFAYWFPWLYATSISQEGHKKRMVWKKMRTMWGYRD